MCADEVKDTDEGKVSSVLHVDLLFRGESDRWTDPFQQVHDFDKLTNPDHLDLQRRPILSEKVASREARTVVLGATNLLCTRPRDSTNRFISKHRDDNPLVQISRIDGHTIICGGSVKANIKSEIGQFGLSVRAGGSVRGAGSSDGIPNFLSG